MLGQPPGGFVVRIDAHLPLALSPLLRAALSKPMPQTLASSCSFCASATTF
jgi:hypothetical protein